MQSAPAVFSGRGASSHPFGAQMVYQQTHTDAKLFRGQEQADTASERLRADRQPSGPPSSANVFNRQETSESSIQGVDVHIPGRIQKQSYLEDGGTGWSVTRGGCNLNRLFPTRKFREGNHREWLNNASSTTNFKNVKMADLSIPTRSLAACF